MLSQQEEKKSTPNDQQALFEVGALINQGTAFAKEKDYSSAIDYYSKALTLATQHKASTTILMRIYELRASAYRENGNQQEAQRDDQFLLSDEAVETSDDNIEDLPEFDCKMAAQFNALWACNPNADFEELMKASRILTNISMSQPESFDSRQALSLIQQIEKNFVLPPNTHYAKGLCYNIQKDSALAIKSFNTALQILKQYDRPLEIPEKIVQGFCYFRRGHAHLHLNKFAEAEQDSSQQLL